MSSVNKVILLGNLCADPEVRTFGNGGSVCNLNLATNESWKDKNTGERKSKVEYHKIVIFNENLIKVASQYLKKGSKVYIEGSLQTRKWQDQSGADKYSTECVLQKFKGELVMLDSRSDNQQEQKDPADMYRGPKEQTGQNSGVGDLDDSIPF